MGLVLFLIIFYWDLIGKIIGYAYGTTMTAVLALEAVKNACFNVDSTKDIGWFLLKLTNVDFSLL